MSITPEHDGNQLDIARESRASRHRELRNLTSGDVQVRGSSYLGEQNEVRSMLDAMEDPRTRWPGAIYELAQGLLDYNDDKKGPPSIRIFLQDREISYEEFLANPDVQVKRVSFVNYIKDEQGLRPLDLILTKHDGKQQEGTLGVHGRGTKIAMTALLAGKHASKVSISSHARKIGAWYGEGDLTRDPTDPDSPEYFQLRFKRDAALSQDTTEIAIHDPSVTFVESLARFPEWFLAANPAYEHYRLGEPSPTAVKNHFTMYVRDQAALAPHETTVGYVRAELFHAQQMGNEAARAEVLPPDLITDRTPRFPIDYVYIDGLKVMAPGEQFSQVYSFWGFGMCDEGYNPKRSNDSLRMQNSARNLLGEVFARCNNPQVFASVFRNLLAFPDTVYESSIPRWNFSASYLDNPEVALALLEAWRIIAPPSTYITANREACTRAQLEQLPTLYLGSQNWVTTLTTLDPRIQTVDQVFAEQAAVERAKLLETQRQLLHAKLEQETEVRRAESAAVQKYLDERGIREGVTSTGEVLKIPQPESLQSFLEMGTLHLLFALAQNEGTFRQLDERTYRFELRADDFSTAPTTVGQMGPIGSFATSFAAAYQGRSRAELTIIREQAGRLFTLRGAETPDALNNMTVHVSSATATLPFHSLVRLDGTFPREEHGSTLLEEYPRSLQIAVATLVGEDGRIDKNKYLASEYYEQYPPAAELMRIRAAVKKSRHDIRQRILVENVNRRKFGLPPIADPYLEDEEKEAQAKAAREYPSLQSTPTEVSPDEVIRDDIPLRVLGPLSHVGISTSGPRRASSAGVPGGREREIRIVPPHMYLTPGFGKASAYLRMYPDPTFTETSLQKYILMEDITSEHRPGLPTLIFTQSLQGGLSALPTPPGFRPVSVFLDGKPVPVNIASSGTGFFTMYTAEKTLPPGLTIQYEPYTQKDHTLPTDKQTAVTADFDHLDPHWKDLVRELNSSTLTPKQKVDIILRAWTQAFKYDKTQEALDTYKNYRTNTLRLNTEIINHATGNCGYADRGFYSLVSLIGVPIQPMVAYLSDGHGNFRMDKNLHANTRVYLNGHWVEVEPQTNYIEDGYTVQPIPTEAKERMHYLLGKLPKVKHNPSITQQGQEGQRIRTVKEELPEALDTALSTLQRTPVTRFEETQTPFNKRDISTTTTKPESRLPETKHSPITTGEIAALSLSAGAAIAYTAIAAIEWGPALIDKINSFATHAAIAQQEQNSTNESLAETLRRIHEQFSHLPPALLIPLIILMSGISYRAGYRRGQKEIDEE